MQSRLLAAISALIVLIGSTLSWLTVKSPFGGESASLAGTDFDSGKATLVLAVIALLALGSLFISTTQVHVKPISVLVLLLGGVVACLSIYKLVDLQRMIADVPGLSELASTGIGLYMAVIGGLVLTVCAGLVVRKSLQE